MSVKICLWNIGKQSSKPDFYTANPLYTLHIFADMYESSLHM